MKQVRLALWDKLPRTRGECMGEAESRANGKTFCKHFSCRYNLIGGLANEREDGAVETMTRLMTGELNHSCALDVADLGEVTDEEGALLMGMGSGSHFRQRSYEAVHRLKAQMVKHANLFE